MSINDYWEKALKKTEIIRPRVQTLQTYGPTQVGYIFLAKSLLNQGDTVVRRGEVMVEKPALFLPPNHPQFDGFESEKGFSWQDEALRSFFLVRGVRFPSMKYNNKVHGLDVFEGDLGKAVRHHLDRLQKTEDVLTGLLSGPEDCWQFSVLIFVASQISRSAGSDLRNLLGDFGREE